MKYNIKNNICRAAKLTLALALGLGMTSCSDFLSIKPLNDVVLENYWTEESDVRSVLNSCYAQLESADCMKRMVIWGEGRSDNMLAGSGAPFDLQQVFKENILETNSYANWQSFYQCINRCNTVIHYAPDVNAVDPNFTESELKATIAEATTLRALCYFYLIRAFRNVPYVTEPSIDDAQDYQIPATSFDRILSSIIEDVESVKDDALRVYGENTVENTCRITRYACYALLADMYLWKGDYAKCIECCDYVIDYKIDQYEKLLEKNDDKIQAVELYGRFPLISDITSGSSTAGTAYTKIFGKGDSFESIFELRFVNQQSVSNSLVSDFYGSTSNRTGQIGVPTFLREEAYNGTNKYFMKTDSRFLENMYTSSNKVYIQKYVADNLTYLANTVGGGEPNVNASPRSTNYASWIIYRLSDIMLMKAEAEVELAGNVELGSTLTDQQTALYTSAFSSVSAIWKRSNGGPKVVKDTLVFADYATSRTNMEDLVLDERQRELMFEGKRWFDFVRVCRRDGVNDRMISKVVPKFQENGSALRIKLASQDIIYWPIHRDELKQNPNLTQNPAYETTSSEMNF